MRKRKASASERSGFSTAGPRLEDVDRAVDDDPHHVDEVPVDAGHLDAAVLLRAVVPAEGPHRDHREQREPDEHVRAVQSREPVEDRTLRAVVRREPDVGVLVDLDEQEGRAQQEGREDPGLQAEAVAVLHRGQCPVHGQRRGQQDGRVHARHRDRQLGAVGGPRVGVHDPDEEVGGEERPEDHHLADDEKQHSEQLGLDPRAAVRLGRVRLVGVLRVGCAGGFHQALTSAPSSSTTTWSTGMRAASARRSGRFARSQPDFSAGRVEMITSLTRKRSSAFIAAVYGSGSPIIPATSRPSPRRFSSTVLSRSRAWPAWWPWPPSCRTTTMKRCSPSSAALALSFSTSSCPPTVRLATTSVTLNGRPSWARSTTTCSTGSPDSWRMRSTRSLRSQPDWVTGCVETMISSGWKSATASIVAWNGSSSPTSPTSSMPCAPRNCCARSTRTCAASRTASS